MITTEETRQLAGHWRLLHLYVRCALDVRQEHLVAHWLQIGTDLMVRSPSLAPKFAFQMLDTLLQTATDEALPWSWRGLCLAHIEGPRKVLIDWLQVHDPVAVGALEAGIQRCCDRLAADGLRRSP